MFEFSVSKDTKKNNITMIKGEFIMKEVVVGKVTTHLCLI